MTSFYFSDRGFEFEDKKSSDVMIISPYYHHLSPLPLLQNIQKTELSIHGDNDDCPQDLTINK